MFCYVTREGKTAEVQLHVRRPNFDQGAKIAALLESADANAIADAVGLISSSAQSGTVSGLATAARFARSTNDFIGLLAVALLDVPENREAVAAKTDEEFAAAIRSGTGPFDFAVLVSEFAADPVLSGTVWPLFKNSSLFQRLDSIGRAVAPPPLEVVTDDDDAPANPDPDTTAVDDNGDDTPASAKTETENE